MATQDLSESIKQRLANGETRESIRQHLLSKGWNVDEINAVFADIPNPQAQGASQPIILPFSSVLSTWDAKTSNLPATIVMGVFGFIAFFILLIAIVLYNLLDPLGTRAVARDSLRESEFAQTQTALERFFSARHTYPSSLDQLVPTFLTRVPMDPSSGKPLRYSLLADNFNYQLCADYETKQLACATSSSVSDIPVVTPTEAIMSSSPAENSNSSNLITGTVFIDYNENGIQDSGDPVFAGATLDIMNNNHAVVCNVKTDAAGNFRCSVNVLGTYSVSLNVPFRYRITIDNPQSVTLSPSSPTVSTTFGLVPIDGITSHNTTSNSTGGAR
jgi:hypothetical protein